MNDNNEVIEMGVLKTKDAADALGVSPTTVKRWVLHFSHCFQKDRLGHYAFTEQDISRLQFIKHRIEEGSGLEQIELPAYEDDRDGLEQRLGQRNDRGLNRDEMGQGNERTTSGVELSRLNEHRTSETPADRQNPQRTSGIEAGKQNALRMSGTEAGKPNALRASGTEAGKQNSQSLRNFWSEQSARSEDSAELLSRIRQIEYTLAHKADEVVSTQVLQHRMELDELRQIVEQLALSVEALHQPAIRAIAAASEDNATPPAKPQTLPAARHKKRGLLRSLFQFL